MKEQADQLFKQGILQYQSHQYEAALQTWKEALILYQDLSDRKREGATWGNLGVAYEALGDLTQAIDCYQQHLAIATEIQDLKGDKSTPWGTWGMLTRLKATIAKP